MTFQGAWERSRLPLKRNPILISRVPFNFGFFLRGKRDLYQAPWNVINDQKSSILKLSETEHFRRGISQLTAWKPDLDGKHFHFTRSHFKLAFARYGDDTMSGAGRVRETQPKLLVLILIFADKEHAALAGSPFGDAD